jgi:hypothetical protein
VRINTWCMYAVRRMRIDVWAVWRIVIWCVYTVCGWTWGIRMGVYEFDVYKDLRLSF